MEYTELDSAGRRELLKNMLRGFEQQHMARDMDARRFDGYLKAIDAGEFAHVDKRVLNDRRVGWTQQRDQAVMDVRGFELDIRRITGDLAALPEEQTTADGDS